MSAESLLQRADQPDLLAGVHVLEVSSRVAGAYSGRILCDLGASVTRIALPMSSEGTPLAREALLRSLHEGKEVVEPDSASAEGLARDADVMISDSLLDDAFDGEARAVAEHLLAVRGGQTVTSITDYGDRPPLKRWAGTPLTVSAWATSSWSVGAVDREPLSLPCDLADYFAGVEAAGASLLALILREEIGTGPQRVQVASADVLTYYVGMMISNYLPYGRPWHRDGARASQSAGFYPAAIFPCKDGAVGLTARQPAEWTAMVHALGDPEWSKDPRFQDAREIARHHSDEVDIHLLAWTAERTIEQIFAAAQTFGFPATPVRTVHDVLDEPQFQSRGVLKPLTLDSRTVLAPGAPYKLRAVSGAATRPSRRITPQPGAPLHGLRVLDFTWVWSGPTVTAGLADLGAEVIKVEHAKRPDPARMRGRGVNGREPADAPETEVSPYFNQLNRGKRSISVDITSGEGASLIRELVADCDVVVDSMRPGTLDKRGLGFEALSEINPSLVMMSMAVVGQTGPLSGIKGYAMVMSGLSGADALVAYEPGHPMGLYNMSLGDVNASGHGLAVLLGAILAQRRTGVGCFIDLSQAECIVGILRGPLLQSQLDESFVPPANSHQTFAPHGHFRCAGEDQWVAVAVRSERERARLAALLGVASTAAADLGAALAGWCLDRTPQAVATALQDVRIPAAPVNSWEQLTVSDWSRQRPLTVEVDHPYIGHQRVVYLPWEIDGVRPRPTMGAPLLGADTAAIERELAAAEASSR